MTRPTPGRWPSFWLLVSFLAVLCSCGPPISKKVLETVDRGLTFSSFIENPNAYNGRIVRWGGVIEKFVPGSAETRLIVTQCPLDNKGYPQTDTTYGEFVARTTDFLDPRIFRRGMVITLAGMVDGMEEELDPEKIPRPLVRVIEIQAWTGREQALRGR